MTWRGSLQSLPAISGRAAAQPSPCHAKVCQQCLGVHTFKRAKTAKTTCTWRGRSCCRQNDCDGRREVPPALCVLWVLHVQEEGPFWMEAHCPDRLKLVSVCSPVRRAAAHCLQETQVQRDQTLQQRLDVRDARMVLLYWFSSWINSPPAFWALPVIIVRSVTAGMGPPALRQHHRVSGDRLPNVREDRAGGVVEGRDQRERGCQEIEWRQGSASEDARRIVHLREGRGFELPACSSTVDGRKRDGRRNAAH